MGKRIILSLLSWSLGVLCFAGTAPEKISVAQMAFNTQAIGDGWLRLLEFMPDKKTVKARTFSPLFYVSPETRHLAWKHDELSEFTFETE